MGGEEVKALIFAIFAIYICYLSFKLPKNKTKES